MKATLSTLTVALGLALAPAVFAQQPSPSSQQQMGSSGSSSMMNSETIRQVQQQLKDQGHDAGMVDGIMGPQTKAALRAYQQAQGMEASGKLDQPTMAALGIEGGAGMSGSGTATPPPGSGTMPPASGSGTTTR